MYVAGLVPYLKAWEWQKELASRVAEERIPPVLLLLEHPHTYTIGRRGSEEHILWDNEELSRRQIAVHWVDRGGDVTYHGPGQLVGYPVFPLAQLGFAPKLPLGQETKLDVLWFVEQLEEILVRTLRRFGILACSRPGLRGVWVPAEATPSPQPQEWQKIASIGIKLTARGVTQHGFALNVEPQMEYWEGLIPCGIRGCRMTSMAELLQPLPSRQALIKALVSEFGEAFQLSMVEIPSLPFDTSIESHYTIP
ncbi:MAG: lipoyl(octanoyl) transferase LipB [Anaerolineales bacterium]|nr:lipoyl(octanoyl) transferase LipB [Anaerolineales bacterium]MDW8447500.1 lipoyl(octanoyl) transferase LipB [Anaerolineales bacterium]